MRDLIDRKAFYEELNKSSVRNNFQEDDFDYIQHLLFVQPSVSEPKTSDWISVKDRFPETIPCNAGTAYSEAVCVLTEERCVCTAIWNGICWIGDFDFWESEGKVTHWKPVIPLPEPPKGETE